MASKEEKEHLPFLLEADFVSKNIYLLYTNLWGKNQDKNAQKLVKTRL